jgi:hypothetical protein
MSVARAAASAASDAGDNKAVEGRTGHLDDERGASAVDGGEVVDTRPPAGAQGDDPGGSRCRARGCRAVPARGCR